MEFLFNIDRKCTIWVREHHHIDAETYEQAREKMIARFRQGETDNTFYGQDFENDTLEDILITENNGWPTAELLNHEGDTIADNTITT